MRLFDIGLLVALVLFFGALIVTVWRWTVSKEHFHVKRFLMTWNPQSGTYDEDLAKLLLFGAFVVSAYIMVKDANSAAGPSENLFALFLGAWVLNKVVNVVGKSFGKQALPTANGNGKQEVKQ